MKSLTYTFSELIHEIELLGHYHADDERHTLNSWARMIATELRNEQKRNNIIQQHKKTNQQHNNARC